MLVTTNHGDSSTRPHRLLLWDPGEFIESPDFADAIAVRDRVQGELVAAGADHEELVRLSALLAASQHRVDTSEERWLSLADEAESLLRLVGE